MPFFDPIRIGASGAAEDFTVDRSLRFNDGDSAYLNRTPSSAGNRKTWTLSVWVKRTTIDANQRILTAYDGSNVNAECSIQFQSDGKIQINNNNTSSNTDTNLKTNRLFRDPSAWYHIVVATDMTQGTAANRVNLYVNGVQETSFSTESYGTQNVDWWFNNNSLQTIGIRHTTGERPFDGYMAELNFIDGSQLTPASFAETDSTTGQWVPINTSGLTFGTNGFRLQFADNSNTTAATLGKDTSGNGNNFTPNNFSVSAGAGNDSVEDTPTNNFCTLNPLFINGGEAAGTFSEGNLKVVTSGSEYGTALSTFSIRYGKYYWEVKQLGGSFATHGIVRGTSPNADCFVGYDPNGKLFGFGYNQGGNIKGAAGTGTTSNASLASSLATFTTNDIIGFASDISNGTLAIYKNNTLIYTITGINDDDWIPAVSGYTSNGSYSINFGQQAFSYTPPTGYKKLNSANLPDPTILLPNNHFNTVLYTGNSSNGHGITGVGFQPDWTWIKARSDTRTHVLYDAIRGAGKYISSDNNNAEGTDTTGFASFDSDGFTVGTSSNYINNSSHTYVGWNWNAGDTDGKTYAVTVVSDSGNKYRFDGFGTSAVTLDLAEGGTYVFDWSDSSAQSHPVRFSTTSDGTHGGGSEYTTGVVKDDSAYKTTITVAASAPTLYYYCANHSGMGGQVNTNSTLGSSNFDGTIQTTAKANATAGFSIVSWTGNGSSGSTLGHGLGAAPKAIITKRRAVASHWATFHNELGSGSEVYLDLTQGAFSSNFWVSSPTSSVFTVSAADYVNANSNTYIAYCFSEVAGYSKFGSYAPNGYSDGNFIFLGFAPSFFLIKNTHTTRNWLIFDNKRNTSNERTINLKPNSSAGDDTDGNLKCDFLSNGVKLRGVGGSMNTGDGVKYIYYAFAESPFKNARAG